jgi:hypothetical protein
MSPEVLIYIQNVKDYFKKSKETRDYFIGKKDEDTFFEFLTEFAQKNFEDANQPELSREQFELLREMVNGSNFEKEKDSNLFFEVNGYGSICLN